MSFNYLMKIMNYTVHKIGGSILNCIQGFNTLESISNSQKSKQAIIISAIGKTSSELKRSLFLAENKSLDEALAVLASITDHHLTLARFLIDDKQLIIFINALTTINNNCLSVLNSVSITNEVSDKTYDRFLALGEDMALALVACFFSANPTVIIIDSREIIKTNSNFRFANLDYDATHFALGKSLLPHFETNDTAITQGFVGSDENGYTTTMGFESSNLTATIISDFLKASELTLWTDVDCIYNADPKLYLNAKPILSIDYETALLAGSAGLKLIYPEMIKIAQKNNIILNFRNGLSTNDIYTQINNKSIQKSAFIIPIKSREIITEGNLSFLDMIQKYHLDNVESISTFNNNSSVIFDRNRRDNSFLADIISSEITIIYIINSNKSLFMTQLIDNYSVLIDNGVVRIQSSNDLRILKLYVLTDNRIDLEDFINNLCNYI